MVETAEREARPEEQAVIDAFGEKKELTIAELRERGVPQSALTGLIMQGRMRIIGLPHRDEEGALPGDTFLRLIG